MQYMQSFHSLPTKKYKGNGKTLNAGPKFTTLPLTSHAVTSICSQCILLMVDLLKTKIA